FSIAWNPLYRSSFLGRIFGDRKTVIRGGYGISYDRINTVGSVIISMLGVGFAQTLSVASPLCNASGAPGMNCAVNGTAGGFLFRVRPEGAYSPPPPAAQPSF